MSGAGPAADSGGDIYLSVGNGLSSAMLGESDYGNSVVRLRASGNTITVTDYFIPFDFQILDDVDLDVGSTAPVLLPDQPGAPHQHLLTVNGKNGAVYLLDRDNLGHWEPDTDNQIVESFKDANISYSNPALWNNALYLQWSQQPVMAFSYDPQSQLINPVPTSTFRRNQHRLPGRHTIRFSQG